MEIKAVFWDLDGTIADTEMYGHRLAFNSAFKESGINVYWDENCYSDLLAIHGGTHRIKFYCVNNKIDLSDNRIKQIHHKKQELYSKIIENGSIKLRTGVKRLISELSAANIEQYIVTTSSLLAVEPLVKTMFSNTANPFSGYITSEDVNYPKPNPEAYLKAINYSLIPKENIMVIEDTIAGLNAALSANLNCIVTLSPWSKEDHGIFLNARAVVNHLGDESSLTTVYRGIQCPKGLVDLNYIQSI